jgi:hypothetical protein
MEGYCIAEPDARSTVKNTILYGKTLFHPIQHSMRIANQRRIIRKEAGIRPPEKSERFASIPLGKGTRLSLKAKESTRSNCNRSSTRK